MRWLILLFIAFPVSAAETYGTTFRLDPRAPTQAPYDHCILDGEDANGDAIYRVYDVPADGDYVQDMIPIFRDRPHPLIFDVTCYDQLGNAGLPADPSGHNNGPGQAEIWTECQRVRFESDGVEETWECTIEP